MGPERLADWKRCTKSLLSAIVKGGGVCEVCEGAIVEGGESIICGDCENEDLEVGRGTALGTIDKEPVRHRDDGTVASVDGAIAWEVCENEDCEVT